MVRSIDEHEYSDLVSIRFFVESDTLDFSTLNLTLDDFLVRLSDRLRCDFSDDFLIRLPSRLCTGGFGGFIHPRFLLNYDFLVSVIVCLIKIMTF